MSEVVRFAEVVKRFGATEVLTDTTFSAAAGETTAIVGESGSGKTTLLQLVNGVHDADGGSVEVFGAPIPSKERAKFRRRIGYAVQGAGLFPHLTCGDNTSLLMRLENWAGDAQRERCAALFALMGLDPEVADRYPHEVSGGQQQRVGLCRALALSPELLLLDEPFSAVDPITRVGIYEQFEAVRAETGVSSLLVTHDMREAVRLAQQIIILREGRIAQSGTVEEIVERPADAYVETLVRKQL